MLYGVVYLMVLLLILRYGIEGREMSEKVRCKREKKIILKRKERDAIFT